MQFPQNQESAPYLCLGNQQNQTVMKAKNIYNLIILDESGSMSSIRKEAVSAMNETFNAIRKSKKENPEANYFVSLVVFEGNGPQGVRTVRDRICVENIEDIALEEYVPGGCTPLYDAMGLSVTKLEKAIGKDDPVMVTIITDGMENASTEYSGRAVKDLVARKRESGWTFAYIGANQDSVEVATELNIVNALDFEADGKGMKKMSQSLYDAAAMFNECCCDEECSEARDFKGLFTRRCRK